MSSLRRDDNAATNNNIVSSLINFESESHTENDPVVEYFSQGNEIRIGGGQFIATSSTPGLSKIGLNLKINEDGTVRDDKLNLVRLQFLNTELANDHKPHFQMTFLEDFNILEKIREILPKSLENMVYIFFCVKPQMGAFKTGLKSEELVKVISAVKESPTEIVLKVNFRRALRPIYSVQMENEKKKKNYLSLHVIAFFKKNLIDYNSTYVAGIDSFRFSNTSKSHPYTISSKKKLENFKIPPTTSTTISIVPSNQSITFIDQQPINIIDQSTLTPLPITHPISFNQTENPAISRIHPDQCFAFQNWDHDNAEITFILLGDPLLKKTEGIKVYFEHNGKLVEAPEKKTQFSDKEYYVPCVKRLIHNAEINRLPATGLIVDVVFIVNNIKIPSTQKYTYLNIRTTAQSSFFGNSKVPDRLTMTQSDPSSEKSSSLFFFPDRCDESEVIRLYENNQFIDINLVDQYQRNIVHYAVQLDFKDLLDYVIQCGAKVDQEDIFHFTPLHMAIYYDKLPLVQILMGHKASLKILDINGNSPYQLAVELKRYDIINFILRQAFDRCRVSLKDTLSAGQMAQVSSFLKSMDGKCTIYWRLHALPYLPHISRLICTAATLYQPKFVHFHEKTGMYSIKINHSTIMIKKLFPDSRKIELEEVTERRKRLIANSKWSAARKKQGGYSDPSSDDNFPIINIHQLTLSDMIVQKEESDEMKEENESSLLEEEPGKEQQHQKEHGKKKRSKSQSREKSNNL